MTKRQALRLSIKHWEEDILIPLLRGETINADLTMGSHCPCCLESERRKSDIFEYKCICAIRDCTGEKSCDGTPWLTVRACKEKDVYYSVYIFKPNKETIEAVWLEVMFLWNAYAADIGGD